MRSKKSDTEYDYTSIETEESKGSDIFCDFLIDGYIRSEWNQTKILPSSIKYIIVSYYNSDKRVISSRLDAFIQFKKLKLIHMQILPQDKGCRIFAICLMLITFIISILALIIGLVGYNEDIGCNDGDFEYNLSTFIVIAGVISICYILLAIYLNRRNAKEIMHQYNKYEQVITIFVDSKDAMLNHLFLCLSTSV